MCSTNWTVGPFGIDAHSRATVRPQRTVLVVVHHLSAGTRLADVVSLVEPDPRVQVLYTAAPGSPFASSGEKYIRGLDGVVVPWAQATMHRFDLAVAANLGGLEAIHAPVLHLDHGAGPAKVAGRVSGGGPAAPRPVAGMAWGGLVSRGRVIPSVIGIAHRRHRGPLARAVPPAVGAARVVGDPCYDRLLASAPHRAAYRRELGAVEDRELVMVSSTCGTGSLLGRDPGLARRLVDALPPDRFRVVMAPHPFVWSWHGRRQVHAWLGEAQRHGLMLLPPEEGWRAALVASDVVVGDHGSVTLYGAALGRPVALAAFPAESIDPGSSIDLLGRAAPRLEPGAALHPQMREVIDSHTVDRADWFSSLVTSAPGASAGLLRAAMYRLMRLAEPDSVPRLAPVPLPRTLPGAEGALR